jgi:FKBP-type peptidyl-prolyl cis-trans isomerase
MQNKRNLYIVVFFVILVAVGAFFIFYKKDESQNQPLATDTPTATIESTVEPTTVGSASPIVNTDKLIIQDEVVGTGIEAVSGKSVTVNYTGTLTDGTVFDSNTDPKFGHVEPFTFSLGAGQVIQGWDQGVAGMKIGGKRKLTIPASLGYGAQSVGTIPANSTLIFEVELLKVE